MFLQAGITGLADVLADLGTIITSIMTYVGDVLDIITGNALMLIPFAFFLIGGSVALVRRILGK